MRKVLLLLVLSFSIGLFANQTAFSFYGYKDVTISGVSGETSYYIKLDDSYEVNKSSMHLNLLYSQALNRSLSYINVLVDDQPVFSSLLSSIGGSLDIPLDQHSMDSKEYVKITIKANLSITGDKCHDIFSGALWLKIQNTSHINWITTTGMGNKKQDSLWESVRKTTTITYPDDYNEFDLRAVSYLYTFIKTHQDGEIQLYPYSQLPRSEKNFLIVGELNKIPEQFRKYIDAKIPANQGLIYSYQSNDTSSVKQITFVTGGDLEGYKKAYRSALNEHLLKSVFANYTLVKSYNFLRDSYKFGAITLSKLNNSNTLLSGTGSLFATYNFSAADFGGHSGDGNIHLEAKHRPVSVPSHAYYNVYLNQVLIYTQELNQDGQIVADIPFYQYQLMKNNTLFVEFLYFPGGGNCDASSDLFYAQMDGDRSGLEINVVKHSKHMSFNTFPDLFYTVDTKMFISRNLPSGKVRAIAEVMYEFNKNTYKDRFYYPEIFFSDKLTKDEISKNAIIGIFSNDDAKSKLFTKSLVKVGQDFSLYNNDTGELMFHLSGNNNTALAQVFYQTVELPVLLITDQGSDPNNMYNLAKVLNLNVADPASNICIADSTRHFYFNVDSSTMVIEYDKKMSDWSLFWRKYKLGFLVLGVLLLGVSLLFIQRKSKRSTESINETRGK